MQYIESIGGPYFLEIPIAKETERYTYVDMYIYVYIHMYVHVCIRISVYM